MPDPGYPLRCIAEASWKLLGKLLPSSILDSSGFLDKILSRTEQGENTSEPWDMDLIEISSSDAESELVTDDDDPEVFDPVATSATSRRSRLSGTSTSSNSTANAMFPGSESFKKAPSRLPLGSNGRPWPGHDSQMIYSLGPRSGAGVGSIHHSTPFVKHDGSRSSGFVTQIDNNGSSYNHAGTSVENGKNFLNDDVHMVDNIGSRILPPSMAHRLANMSGRYPTSGDLVTPFLSGNNEERIGGPDETIIYQGAVQNLMQPKQEQTLPDGLLSVPLLKHQKIALSWMLQKEEKSYCCVGGILADDQGLGKTISTIALIQMQKYLDLKYKSEDKKNLKAEALNLDDDDDNGLVNLDAVTKIEKFGGIRDSSQASSSQVASKKQRPAAGTLIVCPASVLRQWERELHDKVDTTAKLSTLVYHGGNRTKDPYELAKYDVVLTTYAIVNNEVPKQPSPDDDEAEPKAGDRYGSSAANRKRKIPSSINNKGKKSKKGAGSCSFGIPDGTLDKVRWLRVVLDEAQTIKNHRTQVAKACCGLRAKKRWCLSGTPIQNSIDELFSYFKFLKFDPYTTYKAFTEAIKGPIAKNPDNGYRKLQVILKNVMLRRTKDTKIGGEPIISLPPKFIEMRSVNFTEEERGYYFQVESDSRSKFKAYAAAGTVNQNYANILLLLLRLRQACDHPYLVCGFTSGAIKNTASAQMLRQLPRDMLFDLLHRLESSPICQICNDPPEDGVVAMCGHIFCYQCLLDRLEGDDNTCPVSRCKEQLSTGVVFSKPALESCLSDGSEGSVSTTGSEDNQSSGILSDKYCSSKIIAAVEILKSLGKAQASTATDLDTTLGGNNGDILYLDEKDEAKFSVSDVNVRTEIISSQPIQGPAKAIVFSQWTRMLDLVEPTLVQSEIMYKRLDGTMSLAARDKAVREFCTDPKVTVMLMSLKAGNLGLNMVAACHVVLLDLWWNPTTEDQAVDRAHRIGQTRPVTVSRLTIKGTVEDRILALQEQKRKMVASAFGEENGGGSGTRLTLEDLRYLFMGR